MTAEHDDATMDAIALVELAGSGDEAAARAILANCDPVAVITRLARLCAGMIGENEAGRVVCRDCWRPWATETMTRP